MTGKRQRHVIEIHMVGGRGRDRTGDPLLAKQVLSQLSYTPTKRTTLILKHFPVFCPFLFISFDLDRAFTVHLFAYRAHCTVTVHIRSAIAWAISPAWRLSFTRTSRFICSFI